MRRLLAGYFVLASFALAADPQFTKDGQLVRPADYREWIYLSSGLAMTYGPAASENTATPLFDNVLVEPSAYRAFLKTGKWPEKAMFALEIRRSTAKGSINNGGHYQDALAALEIAVKDTSRFEDGWGYFGFSATSAMTRRLGPEAGCNACHSKNAAVENTFVQFYPTLLPIAKEKGVLRKSYLGAEAAVSH